MPQCANQFNSGAMVFADKAGTAAEGLPHNITLLPCRLLAPDGGEGNQGFGALVQTPKAGHWMGRSWGGGTSPLHSRGSPTKGTKSEVKTYARGHNDAPSISKYGCLVQPDAQIAALR